MNESALLYTFSTIPQTLAGGAAILVAVVLYRLGDVDRTIDHARAHLLGAWRERPSRIAWRGLARGRGRGGPLGRVHLHLRGPERGPSRLSRPPAPAADPVPPLRRPHPH